MLAKTFSSLLLVSAALPLFACGGDDGGKSNDTPDAPRVDAREGMDASGTPDAPPDAPPDALSPDAPVVCTVSTNNFGDKGALNGQAYFDPGTIALETYDDVLEFDAFLESGEFADAITVTLYAGFGVFNAGAIQPGTYQLTGAELNTATCGLCVQISTNNNTFTGPDGDYMATGGTVTITTAGTGFGGTLTGTLSNITFHHVDINPTTGVSTQSPDSCTTTITNATFTGTLQ